MKLIFNKIETSKDYLEVSFDNGKSWTTYDKATILTDGITFTDEQCSDIEQIRFKGGIKKTENIDVKYSLDSESSNTSGFYHWQSSAAFAYTLTDKPSVGDICLYNLTEDVGGYLHQLQLRMLLMITLKLDVVDIHSKEIQMVMLSLHQIS